MKGYSVESSTFREFETYILNKEFIIQRVQNSRSSKSKEFKIKRVQHLKSSTFEEFKIRRVQRVQKSYTSIFPKGQNGPDLRLNIWRNFYYVLHKNEYKMMRLSIGKAIFLQTVFCIFCKLYFCKLLNRKCFQLERLAEDEQFFIHSANIADKVQVIFDFYVISDFKYQWLS